jgi:hypothetical protein
MADRVHVRLGEFVDGDGGNLGMHTHGSHWPGECGCDPVMGLSLTNRGPLRHRSWATWWRFTHAVLISAGVEDGWPEAEMVQAIAHDVCRRWAIVAVN